MIWAIAQQAGRQGVTLGVYAVLALVLPASDFGILALSAAWVAVLSVFTELGLGAAIVQRKGLDDRHLNSALLLTAGLGLAAALVGVAGSELVASWLGAPQAAPVVAALATSTFFLGVSMTPYALLQRTMRFKALALRDVTAAAVAGGAAVVAAFVGAGIWSLVIFQVGNAGLSAVLAWGMSGWRPSPVGASMEAMRELLPFTSRMFGFNLIKQVLQNADKVVLGGLFGATALGLYWLAYRFIVTPVASIVGASGNYVFAFTSRRQSDADALARYEAAFSRAALAAGVPFAAATALAAGPALALAGHPSPDLSALPGILACVALAQALISPGGQFMKALGRPGWLVPWSLGFAAATVGGLATGSAWGITGAATGLLAAHVLGVIATFLLIARLLRVSVRRLLDPPLACLLAVAAAFLPAIAAAALGTGHGMRLATTAAGLLGSAVAVVTFEGPRIRRLLGGRTNPVAAWLPSRPAAPLQDEG